MRSRLARSTPLAGLIDSARLRLAARFACGSPVPFACGSLRASLAARGPLAADRDGSDPERILSA